MTQAPPAPPSRLRPQRRGSACRDCGPHLQNAITALEIIIMRRG
jgi:hypothetical protein